MRENRMSNPQHFKHEDISSLYRKSLNFFFFIIALTGKKDHPAAGKQPDRRPETGLPPGNVVLEPSRPGSSPGETTG
jgi:hypothetical protein